MVSENQVAEFIGRRKAFHFDVAPRYSAGSPSQVSMETALSVAQSEEEAFNRTLAGRYGGVK